MLTTFSLALIVRKLVSDRDRSQVASEVNTLEEFRSPSPFALVHFIVFAGIALLLAVIGIYGVIAYSVVQRTREIGIRIGLGASCAVFAQMVLKQGLGLAIAGVILGLGAGMILTLTMAKRPCSMKSSQETLRRSPS